LDHPITRSRNHPIRPLLKWVGGKRQLLPQLRRFYPSEFARYIEPFFGSGAVFFDLYASGRLRGHHALLIDANADLIGCYEAVRDAPSSVADELETLAAGHERSSREHYFAVRDERFNPLREARRTVDGRIAYTPALAAMFIYLNRTGFNGLFRVNASGAFNVPPGRYHRPRIVDRDKLARASEALGAPGIHLIHASYERAVDLAAPGDFLYFDPPYAPAGPTANFTSYTAERFARADQIQMRHIIVELAARGCRILVSNSATEEVSELYERDSAVRAAGLRTHRVMARRAINSNAARRGPVAEVLISNIDQLPAAVLG
jgi:DNA adenine methylase